MKQMGVVLGVTDYERMPYWVSERVLLFLEVQADYLKRLKAMENNE